MLISPENKPGLYIDREQLVAVLPTSSSRYVGREAYVVLFRDGRLVEVSVECGEQLLKSLR